MLWHLFCCCCCCCEFCFIFSIISLLNLWECAPILLTSQFLHIHSSPCSGLPNKTLKKNQNKTSKKQQKQREKQQQQKRIKRNINNKRPSLLPSIFQVSVTPLHLSWWYWKSQYHAIYTFVQSILFANVHCNESPVWFKVFGIRYTIMTGSSLKRLLDILQPS